MHPLFWLTAFASLGLVARYVTKESAQLATSVTIDQCVLSTVMDARMRDYEVLQLETMDCARLRPPGEANWEHTLPTS